MLEYEKWMAKAYEDLKAARVLHQNELFTSATYHCQQATEKALKGYLFFNRQELLKTHDLVKLCALCEALDSDFQKLTDTCELLNPFATKFRYPSEFDLPDDTETKEMIKQSRKIVDFVNKKIAQSATDTQMKIH